MYKRVTGIIMLLPGKVNVAVFFSSKNCLYLLSSKLEENLSLNCNLSMANEFQKGF